MGYGEALRDVMLVEIIAKSSGLLVAWLSQTEGLLIQILSLTSGEQSGSHKGRE